MKTYIKPQMKSIKVLMEESILLNNSFNVSDADTTDQELSDSKENWSSEIWDEE